MKKAIVIFGPPGSGKGTQAELLSKIHLLIHFDTGRHIEELVHNPENKNNKIIQRERALYEAGKLCTSSWVLHSIIHNNVKRIAKAGYGIIFSGSPRNLSEAFGDVKNEGIIPFLEKYYGKENISIIQLVIKPGTTEKRNRARFICSVCGLPRLAGFRGTSCAFCEGKLKKRVDDDPKIIPIRLKLYEERTMPILTRLREEKFIIHKINGELSPYKVAEKIAKILKTK